MSLLSDFLLQDSDLINNNRNRVSVCLCIDTSKSMILEGRMDRVKEGVQKFIRDSKDNIYAAGAIDLCIVTFGGKQAEVLQPFKNVRSIPQELRFEPSGGTPMGQAVELALKQISDNRAKYESYGISSFKPWLIIMSDGAADDDITNAALKVRNLLQKRRLKVRCIDMSGGSEANDLRRFAEHGEVETIDALGLSDFFDMLSRSAASLSTDTLEQDY